MPEFQDKGIAQKAIWLCEEIYGKEGWELETILQESKNCHLYEKMGYKSIGIRKNFYEKPVENAIIMSKIME